MKHRVRIGSRLAALLALIALGGLAAPALYADPIFINDPGQVGSQSGWVLGMDFDVGSTGVTVTSLGSFDSGGDGFNSPIAVGIFDMAGSLVGSSVVLSGSGDTLLGGSRFRAVTPFNLAPNTRYSIVATGYTSSEKSGNSGQGGIASFSTAGGLLSLVVDGGRWQTGNTLILPTAYTGISPGYSQSDPVFLAGTFMIPDYGMTLVLLGLALTGFALLRGSFRLR